MVIDLPKYMLIRSNIAELVTYGYIGSPRVGAHFGPVDFMLFDWSSGVIWAQKNI